MAEVVVSSAVELAKAVEGGVEQIRIKGTISGSPMITLPPGVTLSGGTLELGAKGIRLTRDNTLDGVTVITAVDEVAILNDTSVADLGTLTLRDVRTRGQVLLLAEDAVRAGHILIDGLTVETADVRGRSVRPHGFGVEALQGALTIWNRQADPAVTLTAEVLDVSAGTRDEPVAGSGIFVGGHGDWSGKPDGGTLRVSRLTTGDIVTDGKIPPGTPDLISGAVFVISGAIVDEVEDRGSVTTYGQNDMVLDNWGQVRNWRALAPVTSEGPSGIGFVNFGDLEILEVRAPIATHGRGARGFNLYDGSLNQASFASIATTGDGSVGIQVSRPMGTLLVTGDITTTGGRGLSLVKGVQVELEAVALSVKSGGSIQDIRIGGTVSTRGADVPAIENDGEIGAFSAGAVDAARSTKAVRGSSPIPGLT